MSLLIIGNIIMFIASILMVCIGLLKSNKTIIIVQTIQMAMMALGDLLLGSVPGVVANSLSVIRNVICYRGKMTPRNKIVIIILSTALSLVFNNIGLVGLLPIAAIVEFTLFVDTKSVITMKLSIIASAVLWTIHDAYIKAYSVLPFDLITIIVAIIGLFMVRKPTLEKDFNKS